MEKISVREIVCAVKGKLLGQVDPDNVFISNVCTDSRKIKD